MAHYGELLDTGYDPSKDSVYAAFVEYFEDPTMTKIKDVKNYSMYIAKMHCLLSTHHRYLIIFIPRDKKPLGDRECLRYFNWVSLQTRTLEDNHNVQPQNYKPRRMKAFMQRINLVSKTGGNYIYNAEKFPIQITLLPSKKSENMEYQPKGTILTALETYQTLVKFQTMI